MSHSTLADRAMAAAQKIAAFAFIGLADRETMVLDSISLAWEYARRAPRAATAGTIAQFAVLHVRQGRHLTRAVRSFDGAASLYAEKPSRAAIDPADLAGPGDNPADVAAFRIDFAAWVASLPPRTRAILEALAIGDRTSDVAENFGVSNARISQHRRELEESWEAFTS